ncbi:hypothetical protein T4D_476 [Trichinella pseudospiralis]|uniref:Uncharacterized protein n=1 Tax=Trichinella pseudospiralis TaxID=6337 RepID=A0A0V1FF12_TRIPS|nr:hypothetical protein T4D_476 [Trichinella pseudospiralis]
MYKEKKFANYNFQKIFVHFSEICRDQYELLDCVCFTYIFLDNDEDLIFNKRELSEASIVQFIFASGKLATVLIEICKSAIQGQQLRDSG